MTNHIVLIHGRSFKPNKTELKRIWVAAMRAGIERDDNDGAALQAFDDAKKDLVYYGDLSNEFLDDPDDPYDEAADIANRRAALAELREISRSSFSEARYNKIRGLAGLKEGLADVASGPLAFLGLGDNLVGAVAPDMAHYWSPSQPWGSQLRARLTPVLARKLRNPDDRVALISHSLGTMIAYDTLWKFSHYGEYARLREKGAPVDLFITLGCPLGDATVRNHLKGATNAGIRRYPTNIRKWLNVAAEDDYISHDSKLADDFRAMQDFGLVGSLRDAAIYNLARRGGKANPHHSAGYLIHPVVSRHLGRWLKATS